MRDYSLDSFADIVADEIREYKETFRSKNLPTVGFEVRGNRGFLFDFIDELEARVDCAAYIVSVLDENVKDDVIHLIPLHK